MDLEELFRTDNLPGGPTLGPERRDKRNKHDEPRIHKQLRCLCHAPDILDPVCIREAKIAVEAMPDIIAVQQIGVTPRKRQLALHNIGNGGLARTRKTGEPKDDRLLPLEISA